MLLKYAKSSLNGMALAVHCINQVDLALKARALCTHTVSAKVLSKSVIQSS
jgi:hypothetical protein